MSWAPSVPNSAPQTSFSRPPWCFWEAKIENPSQVKLLEVTIHHVDAPFGPVSKLAPAPHKSRWVPYGSPPNWLSRNGLRSHVEMHL